MLHIYLTNAPGATKYGTTGKAVPGYEIKLIGEDGKPVKQGEMGELYVRGPTSAIMYWNNREKSRSTFQGEWTRSGDKYIEDEDGYYVCCGRADDMLKVSGMYVSPFEVEAALSSHPDVLEAAVVGWYDEQKLVKPKAFVVLKLPDKASDALARALAGARQAEARALQISALDRIPQRTAEDGDRQDPALQAAGGRSRINIAHDARRFRLSHHRRAAPRIPHDRPAAGCGADAGDAARRASAASACGAIFPTSCSRRPAAASSSIRAPVTANRARSRCRVRSPTCTTRRAKRCRSLLDAIGFQRGLLIGHSDGASIAAIYAGSHQDHRVGGLVLIAPHFFTEDSGIASIAEARKAYETGDLRARLARWHADVDNAFKGWNGAWLDPDFRQWDITEFLAYIRVPVLIVQGEDDQYGTVKQIEIAQAGMLLPGRGRAVAGRQALAAARRAGGDAEGDCGLRRPRAGDECLGEGGVIHLSSPRKRGPIRRDLSRSCGVWVPAFALRAQPGRQ